MGSKKLGIVGGMGSVAAAYFFKRVVELNNAKSDQEYIETVIHNNSKIPDRTKAILYGGESPVPELKRSIESLINFGVDYIILACMTAHFFIPELRQYSNAEIINGIEETAKYLICQYPKIKKVGLLASTGTIRIKIFHEVLNRYGVEVICLNDKDQERYVMESIYAPWGIKAGNVNGEPETRLLYAVELLKKAGAETVILGCTELPLVLNQKKLKMLIIDTVDVLINVSISRCLDPTI